MPRTSCTRNRTRTAIFAFAALLLASPLAKAEIIVQPGETRILQGTYAGGERIINHGTLLLSGDVRLTGQATIENHGHIQGQSVRLVGSATFENRADGTVDLGELYGKVYSGQSSAVVNAGDMNVNFIRIETYAGHTDFDNSGSLRFAVMSILDQTDATTLTNSGALVGGTLELTSIGQGGRIDASSSGTINVERMKGFVRYGGDTHVDLAAGSVSEMGLSYWRAVGAHGDDPAEGWIINRGQIIYNEAIFPESARIGYELPDGALSAWRWTYPGYEEDGNHVTLVNYGEIVPEPATIAVVLVGLPLLRRRR